MDYLDLLAASPEHAKELRAEADAETFVDLDFDAEESEAA